jgi:hypothetical protein
MKVRVLAAVLCCALSMSPAAAGGLAQSEVKSDAFAVQQAAPAAGALGGTGTLALIAALVLVAAVAGGGGGGGGGDAVQPAPAAPAPAPAPLK